MPRKVLDEHEKPQPYKNKKRCKPMSKVKLIPIDDGECPFPFFEEPDEETIAIPSEAWYNIYNDGNHFVGVPVTHSNKKHRGGAKKKDDIDICFDSLYLSAVRKGLKDTKREKQLTDFILSGMKDLYENYPLLDEYVSERIERKRRNLNVRKKRFRRKAYLNKWNYFITFTFDSSKHTADSFKKKLRKCLSNLHTRRGWRYMGVFEFSPEKERLHFHALAYIPDGEMLGKITEKKSYSPKTGKVESRNENSFFAENFGVNDFEEINATAISHGTTVNYLLKYIEKQDERIVYSRGIPAQVCKKLTATEIITGFADYVTKYVLFDNVLSFEHDILCYKPKQLSMIDIICNPPRIAC